MRGSVEPSQRRPESSLRGSEAGNPAASKEEPPKAVKPEPRAGSRPSGHANQASAAVGAEDRVLSNGGTQHTRQDASQEPSKAHAAHEPSRMAAGDIGESLALDAERSAQQGELGCNESLPVIKGISFLLEQRSMLHWCCTIGRVSMCLVLPGFQVWKIYKLRSLALFLLLHAHSRPRCMQATGSKLQQLLLLVRALLLT